MANRHRTRLALFGAAVAGALAGFAQTADAPLQRQTAQVRDAYQGAWSSESGNLKDKATADSAIQSLHLFSISTGESSSNQLDQLRWQRNTALERTQGQLTNADRAELKEKAALIATYRPNSFDAHLARFYAEFPASAAWVDLDAAAGLQPDRLELVAPRLTQALREGDRTRLVSAAKDMKARGEVAPALYPLADDLLLSVDRDGVLIVAGEMDGFPLLVRQHAEGKRPDVLVIDSRLLGDGAYRSKAWTQAKASGPTPSTSADFIAQLHARTFRPVFLSLALGRSVAAAHAAQLHVTGLALRMTAADCCDALALEKTWKAMRKTTEAGPLSRNYLVPASALLKHYRGNGDERRAAELEHEIRQLAKKLGATRELQANGILPH